MKENKLFEGHIGSGLHLSIGVLVCGHRRCRAGSIEKNLKYSDQGTILESGGSCVTVSRPLRIEFPGAWYHVMNRGTNRQAIFHDSTDYQAFLTLAGETARMWDLGIHAYALMTNHYHLLIHTPKGNLSRAMQHLGSVYAQRYNHRHHRDGPVFRGRFKAILIEADIYLLQLVRHIHLNPVKAALVDDPAHYPWSSHQVYLQRTAPVDWLVTHTVLSRFGSTWQEAVQQYREFVSQGVPPSLARV